jgi:hypothetical protein
MQKGGSLDWLTRPPQDGSGAGCLAQVLEPRAAEIVDGPGAAVGSRLAGGRPGGLDGVGLGSISGQAADRIERETLIRQASPPATACFHQLTDPFSRGTVCSRRELRPSLLY